MVPVNLTSWTVWSVKHFFFFYSLATPEFEITLLESQCFQVKIITKM